MSYALRRRDRDLTAALRRIAAGEIGGALAQLAGPSPDPAGVHDVRKRIKKLRGLFRLVRPGFAEAAAEAAILREVAQGLAAVREAEVMLATLDRLAPAEGAHPALRGALAQAVAAARGRTDLPERIAAARAALSDMAERAEGWRVDGRDGRVLRAALARSFRRAGAAMATARADPSPEALHEWRKRIKDIWYQARLLDPVWPEGMAPFRQTADDLAEDLGDHHDLAALAAWADAWREDGADAAVAVRALALRTAAETEARAFAQGAQLLAAGDETVALWLAWWRAWRDRD